MSYLQSNQVRSLLDGLGNEYDSLIENKNKLETDCNKLKELIESQINQIQQINNEFEKLRFDFHQHLNGGNIAQIPKNINPDPPQNLTNESNEQEWIIENIENTSMNTDPVQISLLAEIVDVSVISSTSFSPDGNLLAIGSDKNLRVYDINNDTFQLQSPIKDSKEDVPNHIRSLAWSPDSRYIICGGEDHFVRVFELSSKVLISHFKAGEGEVFQLQCAHKSNFFATATGDGYLALWRLDTYTKIWNSTPFNLNNSSPATSLSISDDDKIIAVGYGDNKIVFWNVETQKAIYEHLCHSQGIYATQFVPGSKRIITSSLDTTIKIWDIEYKNDLISLKLWKELDGHTNYVLTLAIESKGKWLLSGSKDLTVKLSSLESGLMVYNLKAHTNTVITVSFNNQGTMFCTGSGDHSVKIWSMNPEDSVQ